MANYPNYNLTGKRPSDTYQNIVQYNITASNLVSSLGNDLPSINITASVFGTSSFAVSSSWAMTASFAYVSFVTQSITQSVTQSIVSSSFSSASFVATSASFASQSISASYAPQFEQISASWASASFVATSASFASQSISSSFAISASWAPDQTVTVNSASWASASFVATSASFASQSISADSASWASSSLSASVLFNNLAFVKINGTAKFGNTTISQSFGPTFTLENPNPSNEFENTPAGILEFRCNEWSGSTDRRQVVRISATKDGSIPYGGAAGQLIISVEDTSGGVADRMIIDRRAISFSGSVVATEVDNYGRSGFTGSLNGTASNAVSASWANSSSFAVSASWAPDQTVSVNSASWASASFVATSASFASQSISANTATTATSSLSASWVNTLNQEVDIEGPQGQGNTSTKTSLLVIGREGWPARILQGGSFVTQSARPVLYVYRDLNQSEAQFTPILQLRTFETASLAPLMVASNDVSDVFTIDYSGSITASGLFGTASWAKNVTSTSFASQSISASWASVSFVATSASFATQSISSSYASLANSVSASGVTGGLTITQYVTSGSGWVTMSFVNGLLISSL